MSLKKTVLFMLILMCVITTIHILWMTSMSILLYTLPPAPPLYQLYQYPLMALISVLPTLLFVNSDQATSLGWKIRVVSHFFLTIIFSLGSWMYFFSDWYGLDHLINNVWQFFIVFTIIYIGAYQTFIYQQRLLADKFNERIQERKLETSLIDGIDVD